MQVLAVQSISVISYQLTEKTPHTPHPTPYTPLKKAPALDRPDRWSGIWVRVVKDTDYPPFQTNNYDEHQ